MNGTKRLLVGTVLSIQNSSFTYPACPDCFSRLIRTSSRYQCQRCGGTCKVAIHRYKLCVKVAEDQKLHIITVFGRCLEKVFGASADFLHRHLLGSVQLPAPLESGRAQELLLQAAEYCLIGRSFIFSVKIPGDLGRGDSVSLSDSCRNIVACQIILPNDDPIGCTVINHFNHLVESGLSNSLTNARAETSADTTLSDSSDLGFSDGSYSLSQSRNLFADYWQQSLGLSPSPLVSALAESALCDCRQCRCNRPEQLSHRAEHISQDNTVFVRRQINPPEDILTTTPCSIRCTSTPRSTHSSLRTSRSANGMRYCKPQSASRVQKMDFGQESYLQNICNSGGCRSQDGSGDGEQLLPQHVTAAETYQGQDGTWEDFPFSESLSKLIAGIESSEGTRSPFCVTVSASFPNSQVSRLRTLKQRSTMSVCKSTRRKRILANKENCSVQSYLNRPNNETGRTVIESGCMIANRGEMDKYNAQGNIAHLSPVVCSSQQPEFQFSPIQTHLPSDWSPELFSENSNVCRQRDDLQRRLF
ncbi:DNA damage-induced apoptosis suppressor protein isoform X2 [Pseudophryne corroboree]|uniref:DNA damage-induced apoptosis suppressor protein isoform X2 n=1 Tax=Pseudophryne corroboree TaxID=495146 RepID=UPI003081ACC9